MKNIPTLLIVTTTILGAFFAISYFNDTKVNADAKNKVKIYEKDGFRVVESNGIPDHETGKFPNDGNPNRISEQKYNYKIPLNPTVSPEGFRMPGPPPEDRNNENGERGERRGRRTAGMADRRFLESDLTEFRSIPERAKRGITIGVRAGISKH